MRGVQWRHGPPIEVLDLYCAICEVVPQVKSLNDAARLVGKKTSFVSDSINNLEAYFGDRKLILREEQPPSVTEDGWQLYHQARKAVQEQILCREWPPGPSRFERVVVGTQNTILLHALPPVVAQCRNRWRDLQIDLVFQEVALSSAVLDQLRAGALHAAVVGVYLDDYPGLVRHEFPQKLETVLVAAAGHSLYGCESVTLAELNSHDLCVTQGDLVDLLKGLSKSGRSSAGARTVVDMYASVASLLENGGCGAGILLGWESVLARFRDPERFSIVRLPELPLTRVALFVREEEKPMRGPVQQFVEVVRECFKAALT